MSDDKKLTGSAFVSGFHGINYQMTAKPGAIEVRITLKYASAWDAAHDLKELQKVRDELQAVKKFRTETTFATAKAARSAKAGRKATRPADAIGRSAAPLLLTYDGGEDDA